MQVLIWIFVGLAAGWLAGRSFGGNGYGRSMDLIMGVAGAVGGGFLMHSFRVPGSAGIILTTFVAVCCAALLTILVALMNGKSVYVRTF